MNGDRAEMYGHAGKYLSRPLSSGKMIQGVPAAFGGGFFRRLGHRIERRVVRQQLVAAVLADEEDFSSGEEFRKFVEPVIGKKTRSVDWMPKKARRCGAVQVTAHHVFFFRKAA